MGTWQAEEFWLYGISSKKAKEVGMEEESMIKGITYFTKFYLKNFLLENSWWRECYLNI